MATSKDVALLAGVSQATVSRSISHPEMVSEEVRARVGRAMSKLGYVPHSGARVLRGGRTNTIGIVISELMNPFYPQVLEEATAALDARGFRTVIWNAGADHRRSALEAIRAHAIDGVIFVTATPDSDELEAALKEGSPVVLVNRDVPGVDCDRVLTDNRAGARAVAEFLVANGRDGAVYIGGSPGASTAVERERHFLERMAELGAPVPLHRRFDGGFEWQRASDIARDLIVSADPPDAIFCANDYMALGALDALARSTADAAERCWVVGFDDIPMASWAQIGLTTVHQHTTEMVARAVELLVARIKSPGGAPVREVFGAELQIRASTPGATPAA